MKGTDRYFVEGVSLILHGKAMPVANLSVGGLFAATDQLPLTDQVLEMEIALNNRVPFRIVGKVTWVNDPKHRKARDLPKGFGIKILRIGFPDKLAILDVLKRASPETLRSRNRST